MEAPLVVETTPTTPEDNDYVEVEVGGKQKIKKHQMVKSLVTVFEKQGELLAGRKIDRITEEEWRLIRDTKQQASGKWLTRDKDGNRQLTARNTHSPRSRSSSAVVVDRITAGAVAVSRRDTVSPFSRSTATATRSSRQTSFDSSGDNTSTASQSAPPESDEIPLAHRLSLLTQPQAFQPSPPTSEPLFPPTEEAPVISEDETSSDACGHTDDENNSSVTSGSTSQEVFSVDLSQSWREAGSDIPTIRKFSDAQELVGAANISTENAVQQLEEQQKEQGQQPAIQQDGSLMAADTTSQQIVKDDQEAKLTSGERPTAKKADRSSTLKKTKSSTAKRTKHTRKQKSRQRVDIFLSDISTPTRTEELQAKSESKPHKTNRSRSLSRDDVSSIASSRSADSATRKLPNLNLSDINAQAAALPSPSDVPAVVASPSMPSRGRTATALASLLSKVSNWTDKDRSGRFTKRDRRQTKPNNLLDAPDHLPRNHSGSSLGQSCEPSLSVKSGRSWGKYEGRRMIRKDSKRKPRKLARSLSFDSGKSFQPDGTIKIEDVTGRDSEKDDETDSLSASAECIPQTRVADLPKDDTAHRINESLVSRSSYQDLVARGIVKEWNEERDVRRYSSTMTSFSEDLQREALHLRVKEDQGDETYDDLIVSDGQNSWHAERGSDSDFVMGAFPALEDDQQYTLFYKKYFYDREHTNFCAMNLEFGPVIVSIEVKTSIKDWDAQQQQSQQLPLNQPAQYFENVNDQSVTTPRGSQRRERMTPSQTASLPASLAPIPHVSMESTKGWSGSAAAVPTAHHSPISTHATMPTPETPRVTITTPSSDDHRPTSEKPRPRLTASFRASKLTGGLAHSRSMSNPPKPIHLNTTDKGATKEDGTEHTPESRPERSRTVLNKLGLTNENRLENYRALIQTRKGARMIFIRSGPRTKDKLKALKVACGVMGYLPEIKTMRFKVITVDIRDELLKLERSFNSQNYKFGVLYCKKDQGENEMFTNATSESNRGWEQFLNFLGDRIVLKGWKNYTGGLDVKNETTGEESIYTEFREQRIMFHVSTMLPYYPLDEQQVERKRHLGNDIVVIVYLEPDIYCVVRMDNVDDEVPAVRVEYAAKAGVRPFGPKLPTSKPFLLDDAFREFFLTKLINGERAALCAPVFAVKLEKTRRALMNELVSKLLKS